MPLTQRDDEVQAFSADGSDQSLAKCIRLWRANWRFQHRQVHRREGRVDTRRIDRVAIVDDEPVWLVAGNDQSKLLRGPIRRGMCGHVPVHDSSRADFQDDEDVQHTERGSDGHKEVARKRHLRGAMGQFGEPFFWES